MSIWEAIILGIIQGLTEFLPVSSSGHIVLGTYFLGVETSENLLFSIIVHGATALSTIVIFRKDIFHLIGDLFKFEWNESTQFILKIALSMIPVGVVGILFEKKLETFFNENVAFVAFMLIITGLLLTFTYFSKPRTENITFLRAFIIGVAQCIAILPGISRSGSTIATGILLGVEKSDAARFSFLMVLPPILGATLIKVKEDAEQPLLSTDISPVALLIGFTAAFISGLAACQWMITIVKKGKLVYFAVYCFIVAIIVLIANVY